MVAVLGSGGYAREIASWVMESGLSVEAFCHFDELSTAKIKSLEITSYPIEIISNPNAKFEWIPGLYPVSNILDFGLDLSKINWSSPFIHIFSHAAAPCNIMPGTVIGPFAYLGTNVQISSCCLIGAGVKIHFDTVLAPLVTVGANSVIGYNCRVGDNVVIGQNCSIQDEIFICNDAVILANTSVYTDIEKPGIYVNSSDNMSLVCVYDFEETEKTTEQNLS
jgi:carbonic anhydrase/acetyltransferase-like protein (isoleucine patch superfamily)